MEAEAEAEAVDGKLKEAEAEAKEKLTAVASLISNHHMFVTSISLGTY